jgi:hypothetical protein
MSVGALVSEGRKLGMIISLGGLESSCFYFPHHLVHGFSGSARFNNSRGLQSIDDFYLMLQTHRGFFYAPWGLSSSFWQDKQIENPYCYGLKNDLTTSLHASPVNDWCGRDAGQ